MGRIDWTVLDQRMIQLSETDMPWTQIAIALGVAIDIRGLSEEKSQSAMSAGSDRQG
jgi:hypothetical protein